jgi:acyl carrier protein
MPAGVAGELYLGGAGLGRGYLKRSALTSERFIADPYSGNGERLYRTGDLARWNAEGQLEYLGRVDHQVKIRGFRIELGEIEAQLLAQPEVREAAVVTQDGTNGQRLVAYVVPHGDSLDTAALSLRLSRVLPDYMLPAAFMVLGGLPLNANGKLDRKALPTAGYVGETRYVAPQGEFETVLADIWREVLGVERVGRDDHFFERGGDSLAAMRVLSLVRSRLLMSVTVRDLFEFPTISRLVEGRSDLFADDQAREKSLQELEALLAEVEG